MKSSYPTCETGCEQSDLQMLACLERAAEIWVARHPGEPDFTASNGFVGAAEDAYSRACRVGQ